MSDLTDAQEKDFSRQVTALLKQYATELTAKGFDPATRIQTLETGSDNTDAAEAAQVKTEEANNAALRVKNSVRTGNYNLASASVGLAEGLMGKDHDLTKALHGIRPGMSNPATRGPHDKPVPPPAGA